MKTYISTLIEAEDGSGDGILQLAPEFCQENDWQPDDVLHMKVQEKTIIIENISKKNRKIIS